MLWESVSWADTVCSCASGHCACQPPADTILYDQPSLFRIYNSSLGTKRRMPTFLSCLKCPFSSPPPLSPDLEALPKSQFIDKAGPLGWCIVYPENTLSLHDLIIPCIRSGEILILPYYVCFINSKSIFLLSGGKFVTIDIQRQLTKWNWMAAKEMVWCKRRNTVLLLQSRYGLEGRKWNWSLTSAPHICLRNVTVLGKLSRKLLTYALAAHKELRLYG